MSRTKSDYERTGSQSFKAGLSHSSATANKKPGTWQYCAILDGWQDAQRKAQSSLVLDPWAAKYFDGWDPGASEHVRLLALKIISAEGRKRARLLKSFNRVSRRHLARGKWFYSVLSVQAALGLI